MSKTYTDEQLKDLGQKTLEARERQKQYDLAYNAQVKWIKRQLVDFYNKHSEQSYTDLVEEAKGKTLEELTA